MRHKYPKPLRILHEEIPITPKKRYLTESQVSALLSRKVHIEEKIDGNQCSFAFKGGQPVLYTKNVHHFGKTQDPGFKGFWEWSWENLEKIQRIPKRHRIFGEWIYIQHHINYDSLPDKFIAFDVMDERTGKLLPYKEKARVIEACGFNLIPLLNEGVFTKDQMFQFAQGQSNYSTSENKEGVVVKSDGLDFSGKLVMREFLDGIQDEKPTWNSPSRQKFNKIL